MTGTQPQSDGKGRKRGHQQGTEQNQAQHQLQHIHKNKDSNQVKQEDNTDTSGTLTLTEMENTYNPGTPGITQETISTGTTTPVAAKEDPTMEEEEMWATRAATDHSEAMTDNPKFQIASQINILKMQTDNEDLMLAHMVRKQGYPNRFGTKIPIKTKWNLDKLGQLLNNYQDKEVVEWMRYGWPTGRLPTMQPPAKTFKNHKGATDHPEALQKYIQKEKQMGAVIGSFSVIPFKEQVGISPISTRPKKSSQDRRVIIDLSFPPGEAVNDGMIKDNYMGQYVKLTFPRVDDLALRIYTLGKEAMMLKVDLSRYFRQLPMDPGDYSLVGYIIQGQLYSDKVLPMGMRTAPYIAQRVTNAIAHIHRRLQYFILNYVDDFLGAEHKTRIWEAFNHLMHLLEEIRVDIAPEKVVPPTTRLEFLGITMDSQTMTMEIPEDKIEEIRTELKSWLYRNKASRKEMESLVGKLQFMGKCIKPGRVFIARLINGMKNLPRSGSYSLPVKARKDIAWWARFLQEHNGVSLIWLHNIPDADKVIATDASKKGLGGIYGKQYFWGRFPEQWQNRNIAELEIRAVLVALKIWGDQLKGQYF